MDHARLARNITRTLFTAQSLSSAGFIAVATLSAIIGAELGGSAALAGVPSAGYLLGSALAAPVLGLLMERFGRRGGMLLGLLTGMVGAGLAARAILDGSFALFLAGALCMGVAQAAVQLGRFAAAEVHPPEQRGRAISSVVLGGAVGAVLGPLMVGPTGRLAQRIGWNELAGPFGAALLLFALAALVLFFRLRPDPRALGREIAQLYPSSGADDAAARPIAVIFRQPAPLLALTAVVIGQLVMVMLMGITSLHMRHHQHGLGDISVVVSAHTVGMFGFSIFSGRLADRWGRLPLILAGSVVLLLACLAAPLSPAVLPIAVALFLLGLGWNFCYVGGSSLLADNLLPAERARTQGFNDLLIGLCSAAGGLGSGVAFAALGYGWMGAAGSLLSLIPGALAAWLLFMKRPRLSAAD